MKRLYLVVAGIVLPLLLVEIILRVTGLGFTQPRFQFDSHTGSRLESGVFVSDADLFWREPSRKGPAGSKSGNFIRVGDKIPAKGQKFRILCLGDSCTRLSASNRPYSVLLQNNLDPNQVEVFNASLPGYTSYQGLTWLRTQLLQFQPDLVVIYFGWNDHWRSTGRSDREYAARLSPSRLRILNLWPRPADPPALRVSAEDYEANLREMARLVGQSGGRSLLILAPSNINQGNQDMYEQNGNIVAGDNPGRLHETYLQVARKLGDNPEVRVMDLARHFQAMNAAEDLLMRDGIHPTENGHLVIARILADELSHGVFRKRGPVPDPVVSGLATLAQSHTRAGEWAQAIALYEGALARQPDDLNANLGLALVWSACPVDSLRHGQKALTLMEAWSDRYDELADWIFVCAAVEAELGRFDRASEMLADLLAKLENQHMGESPFGKSVRSAGEQYCRQEPYRLAEGSRR